MECKDDFDSDSEHNAQNAENGPLNKLIKNAETRKQFEQLAQEYLSKESRKMQREYYELQQKYLKLEESQKALQENAQHLQTELDDKNNQIFKLENEVNALSVNEQSLMTEIAKLQMNLNHNEEIMHSLNNQVAEYQNQNEMLSQKIHEINLNTEMDANKHENAMNDDCQSMDLQNIERLQKHSDTIKRLMDESADLKSKMLSMESEQQTLSLNNAALNNLVEAKAMSLKNIQKQYEIVKNKFDDSKQLNEQYVMSINAKNESIQQLKEQNEKLEHLNEETMKINHDLRHELEQRKYNNDKTNNNNKKPKSVRTIKESKTENKRRLSCDDEEEATASPLLLGNNEEKERRSSVPSSLYAQNLDFMAKSVNKDEYTFLEDLSKEKSTQKPTAIRSTMLKRYHCDAEKEFFHMMVLTVKLEISTKRGITNAMLSDVSPNALWIRAQQKCIAMHEFHDFVFESLLSVLSANKQKNEPVIAQWNSFNSMIADELRQNGLQKFKENNPHLKVVDPEKADNKKQQKYEKYEMNSNKTQIIQKQRALTEQPYSEQQIYFDEDEEEIYAAMNKNGRTKRRDSQKMKKTIIQSYINNEAHKMQQDYDLL